MRVGIGYDIHALKRGRRFVLGGVEIPFPKGPVGHSDGDALWHAAIDAVLGAMSEGDIGDHFPDKDPKWKGASGAKLAEGVLRLLKARKMRVGHLDAVVIAEAPKLGPYKSRIRASLAKGFGMPAGSVSVKAKTNEKMGEIGRGRAIAVYAIASVVRLR